MFTVTHNSVDVTEFVNIDDFRINKRLYNRSDSFNFSVLRKGTGAFIPVGNASIVVTDGSDVIFAGSVIEIENETVNTTTVRFYVSCKSYEHEMDKKLVIERKENTDVETIIEELVEEYAPTFTTTNVVASTVSFDTVLFNRIPLSKCLDKLAQLTNYIWWVDENRDIHFKAQPSSDAPFDIEDNNGKYEQTTLKLKSDFSQVRNSIVVQGGNGVGNARTIELNGDSTVDTYQLPYTFESLPSVTVDGSPVTVGVDFIQPDEDYDVMWSQSGKYLRFTLGNLPTDGTKNIDVTGNPQFPIFVSVADIESITANGESQFFIKDRNIKSRQEAISRGQAELQAYADSLYEGKFKTKTPGLKAGQTIRINSAIHGVDADFRIEEVRISAINIDQLYYDVRLATIRTVGIIQVLQKRLFGEELDEGEDEQLLSFQALSDTVTITDSTPTMDKTTGPYQWDDAGARWGFITWA
jgi:hypothetical protein